jgi:hypothetical protein
MGLKTYYAYCSARDQRVPVVRESELLGKSQAEDPYPDPSDVLCLEYGRACTGATCPLFCVPSVEMARRLTEAGLFN